MKVCLECGKTVEDTIDLCPFCSKEVKFEKIYHPPEGDKNKEEQNA